MAYSVINFKSKKALKAAVADGERVEIFSPGPFGDEPVGQGSVRSSEAARTACKTNGTEFLEGPHFPAPHTWYAQVEVVDGVVVKVTS